MTRGLLLALTAAGALAGCRGDISDKPPFHLIGDMDWQPKYDPEGESKFFADGRAMRPLVAGTVAQGQVHEDEAYWKGTLNGQPIKKIPVAATAELAKRGKQRYDIYCAPCHDKSGSGKGMVVLRGYPVAADMGGDRLRQMSDGEVFIAISNGIRNMPAYAAQIPVEDRWAIVLWSRVLGRAGHASLDDVPAEQRDKIEPEGAQ